MTARIPRPGDLLYGDDGTAVVYGQVERPVTDALRRQITFAVVQGRLYECPVCFAAIPEFKIHRHGVWHASRGEA